MKLWIHQMCDTASKLHRQQFKRMRSAGLAYALPSRVTEESCRMCGKWPWLNWEIFLKLHRNTHLWWKGQGWHWAVSCRCKAEPWSTLCSASALSSRCGSRHSSDRPRGLAGLQHTHTSIIQISSAWSRRLPAVSQTAKEKAGFLTDPFKSQWVSIGF